MLLRFQIPIGLILAATLLFWMPFAAARAFETRAQQALLFDVETDTILYARDADAPVPPASLAKLMTMEVVFHALKTGRLTMDDKFLVSENAWRTGGAVSGTSTMFAELGSEIRLHDLMQGVIIQSANDGCIIIAEGLAGSEAAFAQMMNERAAVIGLDGSVFENATGLPSDGQFVTMRDLVRLARHIQTTYPEYYHYYSQPEFTWNGIVQRNRNPLLRMDVGADGLKTGFTEASGYAIVGSVSRGGRRMIVALSGLASERQRAEETRRIVDWGMRAFEPNRLFDAGDEIGTIRVYGGDSLTVPVTVTEPVSILLPLTGAERLQAKVVYRGPVPAPIAAGDQIASLEVYFGDELGHRSPLYAAHDVPRGPLHRRALDAFTEMVIGWVQTL